MDAGLPPPPLANPAAVWLVMPAFNEAEVIGDVIDEIAATGHRLVVVDDCSADPTSEVAQQRPWVDVLRHPVNLGQGAALQTGIEHALARGAEIIVTFDSDGQHRIEDIPALLAPLRRGEADVALGSRFLAPDQSALVQIPARRRAVLRMAAVYTRFTTGLPVTDAHNGLRAFTAAAARRVQIHQNRMAHASEILAQIASNRLRLVEVPVVIRYTPYSLAKGQRLSNALNILWDLLLGHIRR